MKQSPLKLYRTKPRPPKGRPIITRATILRESIHFHCPSGRPFTGGTKGVIQAFSDSSRLCLKRHIVNNPFPDNRCLQVALTYHEQWPEDGRTAKNHINRLLTEYRQYSVKRYKEKRHYLWLMEFQSRGAVHFHLFVDEEPGDTVFQDWLASTWHRITGENSDAHLLFHGHGSNFVPWELSAPYLVKYISKSSQKHVPDSFRDCGRFWGVSHDFSGEKKIVHFPSPGDIATYFEDLPSMAREHKRNFLGLIRTYRKKMHSYLKGLANFTGHLPSFDWHKSKIFLHGGGESFFKRVTTFFPVTTYGNGFYQCTI